MEQKRRELLKSRFVRVTDEQGNEYVCKIDHLKSFDELSEEEKAACTGVPQHGPGE
ncbi:MAG: hypothetical protein ABII06_17045 [Pseudomonadota bacterium]